MPTRAVDAVYRADWGRIVATLIRLVGDFDVAEAAVREAFAAAVDQWRIAGIPDLPRAWIVQTARHKAIDRLRRRTRFEVKVEEYTAAGDNYQSSGSNEGDDPVLTHSCSSFSRYPAW